MLHIAALTERSAGEWKTNCGHARETFSYQPSAALRHLIKTRDRTCSYPGCRRAASKCDDDHTLPHHQGGRTCECNLSPAWQTLVTQLACA